MHRTHGKRTIPSAYTANVDQPDKIAIAIAIADDLRPMDARIFRPGPLLG